jgi:hypothetical protein
MILRRNSSKHPRPLFHQQWNISKSSENIDLGREIAHFLTRFFQSALNNGDVPKDWKYANVTAIFRKGGRFKAGNYRPVSLTCICCMVQEHILTNNILKHLDRNTILTDCQHGFIEFWKSMVWNFVKRPSKNIRWLGLVGSHCLLIWPVRASRIAYIRKTDGLYISVPKND